MSARFFARPARLALAGGSAAVLLAASNLALAEVQQPAEVKRDKRLAASAPPAPLPDLTRSTFVWGSSKLQSPGAASPELETSKKPKPMPILDGVVLRDLALHEHYAVAVDSKGNLLHWNADAPALTTLLSGRNITKVALTQHKVYALSSAGKVYVLSSAAKALPPPSTASWLLSFLWSSPSGAEHLEVKPDNALGWREKVHDIQAGSSHLLALTSTGRCFSSPVDAKANEFGQLGIRQVDLQGLGVTTLYPQGFNPNAYQTYDNNSGAMQLAQVKSLPKAWVDERVVAQLEAKEEAEKQAKEAADLAARASRDKFAQIEKRIDFCQTLYEVPALKDLRVAQLAIGDRHNLVRTANGKVLGFGANGCGQLGVGNSFPLPVIPAPTEVALSKHAPKNGYLTCSHIAAGGDSSYFVTERTEPGRPVLSELYACGNGQFGSIGNGLWNHQLAPCKIKALSGLLEWDEKRNAMAPIGVHALSAGRNHIAATLGNSSMDQSAAYGRDVYIWGQNTDFQLGNGKRAHAPMPVTLPALPRNEDVLAAKRLQLAPQLKINSRKAEETIVCGWNSTAVYWKAL